MPDYVNEYKWNNYQKIESLNEKDNLWLVVDSVTKSKYVMRKISLYSKMVYEVLAAIYHPNIVKIIDVFSHNDCIYTIEEYLEWEPLSHAMADRRFSKRDVFSIGIQLLEALEVLYEYKIVHRDIKPDNILIDKYGNIKLIDFDIARLFSEDKYKDTSVKGSSAYASPEQFGFSQTDHRTDIYSLGVTLNEIAAGSLPNIKICSGRLGIFVRHCIKFDPGKRYQTAGQALRKLKWLQRIPFYISIGAVLLCLILTGALALILKPETSYVQSGFHTEPLFSIQSAFDEKPDLFTESSETGEVFDDSYLDRIISVYDPESAPSLLMSEDKDYEFSAYMAADTYITASAVKTEEHMELTCTLDGGEGMDFVFDDVFSDTYHQLGYSINTDFEKTSPEYEILFIDFDENEKMELLVSLAWRQRIDTPNPDQRYYFTEYSTVWVVYLDEQNTLCCSDPIYFEGEAPSLQEGGLLFDRSINTWYYFYEGIWDWY